MRINKICILGGTGFVGRTLASRLVTQGIRVKILSRAPDSHPEIKVLSRAEMIRVDPFDQQSLSSELADCQVLVNLVGILNERKDDGAGFKKAHVELAHRAVTGCREAGIKRLLHMSALNADVLGPSHYLRTKGEAENWVHEAKDLNVTSFRPSVIFGRDDSFINRFAGLLKIMPGIFPLACPTARFAPVFVSDVVQAMVSAIVNPESFGQRIELCGPKEYSLQEIVGYVRDQLRVKRLILPLPDWAARLQAEIMEHVPGKPFSRDNLRSLSEASICRGSLRCSTPMEAVVPGYLA